MLRINQEIKLSVHQEPVILTAFVNVSCEHNGLADSLYAIMVNQKFWILLD